MADGFVSKDEFKKFITETQKDGKIVKEELEEIKMLAKKALMDNIKDPEATEEIQQTLAGAVPAFVFKEILAEVKEMSMKMMKWVLITFLITIGFFFLNYLLVALGVAL